ncbi:unnamed protein product, partial [Mesorhabditis spiculigera]
MGYLARKRFYEQHVQAKAAWLSFRGKFGRDGTKGIDYAMVTKRLPSTHEGTHDLCFRMGIRRYGQTGIVWKADEIFEEEIVPHGNKGQKAEWLSFQGKFGSGQTKACVSYLVPGMIFGTNRKWWYSDGLPDEFQKHCENFVNELKEPLAWRRLRYSMDGEQQQDRNLEIDILSPK